MVTTILGIKKEMSVRFDQLGRRFPVTVVQVDPNVVILKKDGQIMLGLGQKKKAKKTENAFISALGFAPKYKREIKIAQAEITGSEKIKTTSDVVKTGDKITLSIFEPGDQVKVCGITRGKGFAGTVKRWGFAGGSKTHGQSDRHRAPGSIGQTTTPGRVYKGKKMAGHMGHAKLTITGLEVIEVDSAASQLIVKGSVPGVKNGFLIIEKTGKVKGYRPPPKEEEEPKEKPATSPRTDSGAAQAKGDNQKLEEEKKPQSGQSDLP